MADTRDLSHVLRLIDRANQRRRSSGASDERGPDSADAERELDARFAPSRALAVYGTLAPGQPNHHVVAPLGGTWARGVVQGDMLSRGWAAALGYPAFRPRLGGPPLQVQLLTSAGLAGAWPSLDEFEGPEYRRLLVPVFEPGSEGAPRLLTVANLYAATEVRS